MDIMITGAGLSLNECALLGVPTISIVLNQGQLKNALSWKEYVKIRFVDLSEKDWKIKLLILLNELKPFKRRLQLNIQLKRKVDSMGSIRSAKEILSRYTKNLLYDTK
jgi:spore coat polysaccharide biosynthesis predicted glycosyltransferase SpsG